MNQKVLIIAEVGVNHNGDFNLAKDMIYKIAETGVDVIKFQTFKTESVITKNASKAEYQKNSEADDETQFELVKKLEFSFEQFKELYELCTTLKVAFFSTAFDQESLDFLNSLKLNIWKIPSGEITNVPYLEYIGKRDGRILMSTGMCSLEEVEYALNILIAQGVSRERVTILQCNTEYPTPMRDVNLNAMLTMKNKLKTEVGYSDHTLGFEASLAAVALGAKVIEKHVTLSSKMIGPDHAASMEISDLGKFVDSIRMVEECLGSHEKQPTASELKNRAIARRCIVAKKNIKLGDTFTSENLICKRAGKGISAIEWHNIIGKKSERDYIEDECI